MAIGIWHSFVGSGCPELLGAGRDRRLDEDSLTLIFELLEHQGEGIGAAVVAKEFSARRRLEGVAERREQQQEACARLAGNVIQGQRKPPSRYRAGSAGEHRRSTRLSQSVTSPIRGSEPAPEITRRQHGEDFHAIQASERLEGAKQGRNLEWLRVALEYCPQGRGQYVLRELASNAKSGRRAEGRQKEHRSHRQRSRFGREESLAVEVLAVHRPE